MKKILFLLFVMIVSLQAKPCMTDIYFGNGVWNTKRQGLDGKKALRNFLLFGGNTKLDIQKEGVDYVFKHAYNPSYGTTDDLIETFYQLKDSGQVSNGYFQWIFTLLNRDESVEPYQKLQDIIRTYNDDAIYMFTKYDDESFKKKHNVLLVSHSQGNLFGNKMYTLMTDKEKSKFRMVSVGTPANSVAGGGPYVTLYGDFVIRPIPGSLPANTNGGGHSFVGAYLGKIDARIKIASYVRSAYDNLMQTTSCTQYDFTRVWMPTFGLLNVYGSVDNVDELVGEITLEQSDAILDNNTGRYVCPKGNDSVYWGDDNYIGNNWTYNYKDNRDNNWIPGQYITSRSSLDDRSDTNDTVRKDIKCVTISLNKDGDLYNVIYDMFPEKQ